MIRFSFGDIVVVENNLIGVVVKSWQNQYNLVTHEVYVRDYNSIVNYPQDEIQKYIHNKQLLDEETETYL